jgi:hypothetical protein
MTASVDEIRPPATLLAQNATHDDASKVALAQLLKNKLLPRGSDGDAVAVESRFAAVNQRASDLLLMAVQQQQQHALPDAPATIPEETTEQTDSQSEPAFSPAEQLAAAVNIPLTKSEPLAGPADAALALRSVINVASTTRTSDFTSFISFKSLSICFVSQCATSNGPHCVNV